MARSAWKYGKRSRRRDLYRKTADLADIRDKIESLPEGSVERNRLLAEASLLGADIDMVASKMYVNRNRRGQRATISERAAKLMVEDTLREKKPWEIELQDDDSQYEGVDDSPAQ